MTLNKTYYIAIIGFCFLLAPLFSQASDAVPLDKVVAVVNNSVITQNQLNDTVQMLTQQLQATGQPLPSADVLRKKALDQAIGELLQLQVAQHAHIVVSDADVTHTITKIAEQNHLTLDQLKEALQKQGIQYKTYRTQIHDQIMMHQVQQQALSAKVSVTDAQVQAYLKKAPLTNNQQTQYHLDDLLIPLSDSASASDVSAATNQANDLLQKARAGASLSELAQNNLQHTDLQWRTVKDLPPVFSGAVTNLKVGDVTGPIKAPNGLHILRLLDERNPTKSLTKAEAKQAVLQEKMQEKIEEWVKELRKTAYIKIM